VPGLKNRAANKHAPCREACSSIRICALRWKFIWGFVEAEPIVLQRGERVRFVLINDSMMEHPIHLHGLWSDEQVFIH
jgi:hypothetical protein